MLKRAISRYFSVIKEFATIDIKVGKIVEISMVKVHPLRIQTPNSYIAKK